MIMKGHRKLIYLTDFGDSRSNYVDSDGSEVLFITLLCIYVYVLCIKVVDGFSFK